MVRIVRMRGDGSSTASMRPRTSGIVQEVRGTREWRDCSLQRLMQPCVERAGRAVGGRKMPSMRSLLGACVALAAFLSYLALARAAPDEATTAPTTEPEPG